MHWLRRPSIARRLVLAVLAACGLVWVAIYIEGLVLVQYNGSGNFDRDMATVASALREVTQHHPEEAALRLALAGVSSKMKADEQELQIPHGYLAFNVWRSNGNLVATMGAAAARRLAGPGQVGYFDATSDGHEYRVLAQRSEDGQHHIEVLQHKLSRQAMFDSVMFSSAGLLMPLLIGFPLLLLPVWTAVHTGLKPLRQLTRQLASRKAGDLAPLSLPHTPEELVPVVEQLNGTLRQLRTLLQRERNFLADAAHEIRTPLAVISAQGDALLNATNPAERQAAAQRLRHGVVRSSRLVNQLLSLARLDADVEDDWVETNLADAARDCLAEHAAEAAKRGVELAYVGPDSFISPCPGQAVTAVLNNLVGNAVRYGREGGTVEVRLDMAEPGWQYLRVSDDGPGIALPDRLRMFERFRRGRNAMATGSGLGLAIVASAARQLQARVEVGDGLNGQGVSFTLTWPAPASPQMRLVHDAPPQPVDQPAFSS